MLEDMLDMLTGNNRRSRLSEALVGVVVGATIGGVAGVLLAPQSGSETR